MEPKLKSQRYVVTVDAICGRGQTISRGEVLLLEMWTDYVDKLLEMGAITVEAPAEVAVDAPRFMLR